MWNQISDNNTSSFVGHKHLISHFLDEIKEKLHFPHEPLSVNQRLKVTPVRW